MTKRKNRTYAHIICDMSGSMSSCRDETVQAINSYVAELAADKDLSSRVSLTTFNSVDRTLLRNRQSARKWQPLESHHFVPAGMTPLLDAVGQTVTVMREEKLRKGERVVVVILTDGLENMSRIWRAADVRQLLEKVQKKLDWLVVFLGANQDAWAEGARIGTQSGTTMDYNPRHISDTMAAVSRGTRSHSHGASAQSIEFTDDERARSKGK